MGVGRRAIAGIRHDHRIDGLALRAVGRDGEAAHEEALRRRERLTRAVGGLDNERTVPADLADGDQFAVVQPGAFDGLAVEFQLEPVAGGDLSILSDRDCQPVGIAIAHRALNAVLFDDDATLVRAENPRHLALGEPTVTTEEAHVLSGSIESGVPFLRLVQV